MAPDLPDLRADTWRQCKARLDAERKAHGAEDAEHTRLLGMAFRQLRRNPSLGRLRTLSLRVGGREEKIYPGLANVSIRTSRVFRVAMGALRDSALLVDDLDIFGQADSCSLPCEDIALLLPDEPSPAIDASERLLDAHRDIDQRSRADNDEKHAVPTSWQISFFQKLSVLKLSLSNSLYFHGSLHARYDLQQPRVNEALSRAAGERTVSYVASFLKLMPALLDLQLHFYKLDGGGVAPRQVSVEHRFFDLVASTVSMPLLTSCTLKGIDITVASLLLFLRGSPHLERLTLVCIHLRDFGTFRPLFDHLTHEQSLLEYLHLDDLFQEDDHLRHLHFDGPGKPKYRRLRATEGPNTLTRVGSEAKQHIGYRLSVSRPLGSAKHWRWLRAVRNEYGPL